MEHCVKGRCFVDRPVPCFKFDGKRDSISSFQAQVGPGVQRSAISN